MSKKISDIVLMSDIDGTLLSERGGVPKRNIEALERFTAAGGRFGVATGRALNITRPIVDCLPINFPCVMYNGGVTYSFEKEEYLDQVFLPRETVRYFEKIWQAFPDCGAIWVADDYFDLEGSTEEKHNWWLRQYSDTPMQPIKLSNCTGPAYKALLVLANEQRYKLLQEYLREHAADFAGVRFVYSDATMFEMLPLGSSKGDAIEKLAGITGVKRENVVSIGDYHNDIEMLEFADISAAPLGAHDDVKAVADLIVGPCHAGAVADLIEHMEELYSHNTPGIRPPGARIPYTNGGVMREMAWAR